MDSEHYILVSMYTLTPIGSHRPSVNAKHRKHFLESGAGGQL